MNNNTAIKGGYILLARKITEHFFARPAWHMKAWLWLCIKANHKPKRFNDDVWIERGQTPPLSLHQIQKGVGHMVGARPQLPDRFEVSRLLSSFREEKMITTKMYERRIIITILNYDFYQDPASYRTDRSKAPRTAGEIARQAAEYSTKRTTKAMRQGALLATEFDVYYRLYLTDDKESLKRKVGMIKKMVKDGELPRNSLSEIRQMIKGRKELDSIYRKEMG